MKKRILAIFLTAFLCSSLLFSCAKSEKHTVESFEYFDTYSSLTLYCDENKLSIYESEFKDTLEKYHELFDIYNSYDGIINLKHLNENASIAPVTVSSELFEALEYAKELSSLTNGKFNLALGAITSIWHNVRESASQENEALSFPSENEISDALSHTDLGSLVLNSSDSSVFFKDPRLALDLGGIAKGYVASLLCERLILAGCESFLINLGGNVVAFGKKPSGESWSAAVENPFNSASLGYNEVISLHNSTLVTSGSYQRFFTYHGKSYSHIINPQSGYPADGFSSVSVKAPHSKSALADALSTALFCMSYEEGLELVSSIEGVSAIWVFNDGSYKISSDSFGGAQ